VRHSFLGFGFYFAYLQLIEALKVYLGSITAQSAVLMQMTVFVRKCRGL